MMGFRRRAEAQKEKTQNKQGPKRIKNTKINTNYI